MVTPLILVTPCIALMAPFLGPFLGVLAVLALAATLGIVMIVLFVQTWHMVEHEDDEAVVEDATNIARAAFAALERNPGAISASFRAVDGVVMHRGSTARTPNGGEGSANGVGPEVMGSWNEDNGGTYGGKLESCPELFHAWGRCPTSSGSNFRKGHLAVKRLGGFWVSVRSAEDSETVSQMV